MRVIRSFLRRTYYFVAKVRGLYWRRRCEFCAYLAGGQFLAGPSTRFKVPVRADGVGIVCVKENVSLGYRGTVMLGNGQILLQARTEHARVCIGARCHFSNNVSIVAREKVVIGQDCLVGDGVCILDSDFHEIDPGQRHIGAGRSAPIAIGNNVWLGSRAMILKGVSIGVNSIVAPMSVVTKNVPPNVIVAGVPARIVKKILD